MNTSLLGGNGGGGRTNSGSTEALLGGGGSTDRFGELQGLTGGGPAPDLETGPSFMGDFFGEVAKIKSTMEVMKRNVDDLKQAQQKDLADVYGGADHKAAIEDLTDDTNAKSTMVKNQLQKLDGELKATLQDNPGAEGQSDYKIRRNMHATLTKKFLDQMQEYQDAQSNYKKKVEEMATRQFKIVKPDATQSEIDEVLETGGQGIFTQNMLTSQNAMSAYEDVQEKHKAIQRLEQSIQELHQLFVDLSVLVESQGELLNDIEYNVSSSVDFMKQGVTQLEKANEYAAKSRKKMCCLVLFFIVVIAVVVLNSGILS